MLVNKYLHAVESGGRTVSSHTLTNDRIKEEMGLNRNPHGESCTNSKLGQ